MSVQSLSLLAALLLSTARAEFNSTTPRYTVWASVIYSRTGERTPEILGTDPVTLTSVGAHQQGTNGLFFRERYFEGYNNFSSTNGVGPAPLTGMSPFIPDVQKLYVQALDEQCSVASAQAFLQGLYPPDTFAGDTAQAQTGIDPTGVLANGSYLPMPLDGYQFAQIHSSGEYDPEIVYVGGSLNCPAFVGAVENYIATPGFVIQEVETSNVYNKIGPALLSGVLPPEKWGFINAYAIYDYLSYQYQHNSTAQQLLDSDEYKDPNTGQSYLYTLQYYSNLQQWNWYGNMEAINDITGTDLGFGLVGSISTIAGNTLASKVLGQLQTVIAYQGEYDQLSLLFGDYEPMLSFFSLANLPALDSNFYGMPDFGSVVVFELFSYTEPGSVEFPSEEELWVRFLFRNGTDANSTFQSYPLFDWGPDSSDMTWSNFQTEMLQVAMNDIGDWCQQCGASYIGSDRIFCSYWNSSDSIDGGLFSSSTGSSRINPAVAGAIGAIVTLVVAGLLVGLLMLLGGVRFHRVHSRKSEMGGFKGSQKLASDQDLTIPKGGAVVGATVETPASPVASGHERVGSWELKQHDLPNIAESGAAARRPSFEDDIDIGASPFREPVKPDERV